MRYLAYFTFFLLIAPLSYAYEIGNIDAKLTGSLNEVYDDNISYLSANAKEDFITDTSLGLAMDYTGKIQQFLLSGKITQHNFNKHNEFDNTAEDLTLDFKQELSRRDRISFNNRFSHSEEPRSIEDEFGRAGDRYSYYRNTFNAAYNRDISRQLALIFTYINELYDYSRDDLNDSYLNHLGMEADYSLSSKTILIALMEYIHREYEHTANANTKRAAGGIRQYLTNQLYLDLRGGQDFIKSVDNQDSTGQFVSASLTDEIDENTNLGLSYLKEDSTTAYSQDIFKSQRISFSFIRQLFERLRASISAFFGKGEYSSSNIEDRLKGANAEIAYDLSSKAKLKISYNYSRTNSNIPTREYTKNVVLVGVSYEF